MYAGEQKAASWIRSGLCWGLCLFMLPTVVMLIWWWPGAPDGERFADEALAEMDAGWFARGPRWEQARRVAWEETRGASTAAEAFPAVDRARAVAGGRHSSLFKPRIGPGTSDSEMPTVVTRDGITTIVVPALIRGDETLMSRYATTLAEDLHGAAKATTCGWIVDLRKNAGGNFQPMLAGLSPLVTDGKVAELRTR